jgi:2-polyprenyl-3-methyl-5-hydroxy-6-metoxy-1,4-benzoquinol methylase
MVAARSAGPVAPWWPAVADLVPDGAVEVVPGLARLRRYARRRADLRYRQRLAPRFLWHWAGQQGLDELKAYLGDEYDEHLLHTHEAQVEAEEEGSLDEATFYRTSHAYLYDLTAFGLWDTKLPYFEDLRPFLRAGARVLDYGCGIGTDGLRLIDQGHQVGFADFANPSTEFLRWRLERRDLRPPVAEVHDLDDHVPGGFDLAYSFDVIEHVEDPHGFLAELEARADVVAVNLLEPDPDDVHLHKPLPIDELLDHAQDLGILRYRKHHGRSHLVIYRSASARGRPAPGPLVRVRSLAERRLGNHPTAARLLP